MDHRVEPLLGPADLERLRAALGDYTVPAVHDALGLSGVAAQARGDLTGAARALRGGGADAWMRAQIELFVFGAELDSSRARAALDPLPLDTAAGCGLIETSAGSVRAALDIRPYAESIPDPLDPTAGARAGDPWWVLSDLGSDVRPGPLPADHVLGIGAASLTLAQATPRNPIDRALDIGTGCGVQSLHLGRHSRQVSATDVSRRALTLASTTAALSGQRWDLRRGSLLGPVVGERFDLVVANPPFVVSAGVGGYDYPDSGLAGDGVSEALLRGLPGILSPGGTAILLANWIIPRSGDWRERVTGWLAGRRCDAWIWQREVADPGEYVSMWLRDCGEKPGTATWAARYDAWLDWFDSAGVAAVGMGMAALRRTDARRESEVIVAEDVPQPIAQPVGEYLSSWFDRQRWLAGTPDDVLFTSRLSATPGLVRTRDDVVDAAGWGTARDMLRQSHQMRWELEIDDAVAAVVAGCDGSTPLGVGLAVLAAALGEPVPAITRVALPVVRDLIARGFLAPVDLS